MKEFPEHGHYTGERTLVWEPAEPPKKINHGYDRRAMEAIADTFGPYPITLGKDELRILKAMHAAGGWRPFDDLVELVEKHGAIRIWLVPGWSPSKEEISASLLTLDAG